MKNNLRMIKRMTGGSSLKQKALGDTSVPVVVMKSYHHYALDMARSLGRLGVQVYGIGPYRRASGLLSRYFSKKFLWDVDDEATRKTVQYLLAIGNSIGESSILIPTTDKSAMMVADFANKLGEWYIFPKVSTKLVHSLINKEELHFLANRHGVPTIETCFPRSRYDVEEYLEKATFPVILKRIDGLLATQLSGQGKFITRTKRELLNLYDRYEERSNPNFMLQEYITGDASSTWMYNGYFNEKSECLFGITGNKIRQHPVYTGVTSLGVCRKNDTIMETTHSFMKQIGYKGPVDIDYVFDARDATYKILDVNPRVGSTFRLFATDNGMDVLQAEYLDLTGQPVQESHIVEGRKWVVEDYDLISSLNYIRDKNLTFQQWAKSFRGVKEAGWFAWDDLLPFFAMLAVLGRTVIANPLTAIRKNVTRL